MSDRAIFIASPAESNDRWRERLKETASSVARIEIMKASRLALTIVCAFSATLASAQPVMRQSIYSGFASSGLSTWIAGQDSVSGADLDLQQFVGRWCGHNNNPDELSDMNDVYILRSDHSGQYQRPRGQPGTIRCGRGAHTSSVSHGLNVGYRQEDFSHTLAFMTEAHCARSFAPTLLFGH